MKTFFNYTLVSLFFVVASLTAQAQVKIGYTSASLILPELPAFKEKQAQIEKYAGQLQEQITEKEAEILTKMKTLEERKGDLLPVVLRQKQQEIQTLQQGLQQMQQSFQQDLARFEEQTFQPLYSEVQEKINEVAEEENFDLILNAYDGTGTSLLLAAPEAEEITDKVLKKLGVTPKTDGN